MAEEQRIVSTHEGMSPLWITLLNQDNALKPDAGCLDRNLCQSRIFSILQVPLSLTQGDYHLTDRYLLLSTMLIQLNSFNQPPDNGMLHFPNSEQMCV